MNWRYYYYNWNKIEEWLKLGVIITDDNIRKLIKVTIEEENGERILMLCNYITFNKDTHGYTNEELKEMFTMEDPCPICYDTIYKRQIMTTPCGHQYHMDCLMEWRSYRNTTCPLCRKNIL